ncbi:ABC transporter ATP-binding protein/permease [Microbacterium testaceum]|uniref:ABC transporter ATP-binding protein/permease n=1 Tax=Microbacterium testaceum TaxID=2033 RepID=UPI001C3FB1A5|nr:ABC transporter ATP-binding protein/permease [Microbacterium testaceum]
MTSGSGEGRPPALELRNVSRRYASAHAPEVLALDNVSLRIRQGEFVAIVGPSGGGKSTLLNVLGLLDYPDKGDYLLDGVPMPSREGAVTARVRSTAFAFIFQAFHLLPSRPVLDSVELGLIYRGVTARDRPARAALARVGLGERANERASHLSGGQQQRAAIARAIASDARIVLADEPTGNLDSENAQTILSELKALKEAGATVIVVTHSADVAAAADRQLRIQDGRLVSETVREPFDTAATAARTNGSFAGDGVPSHTAQRPADHRVTDQPSGFVAGVAARMRPAGTRSRQRVQMRDILRDAWRSVRSRPAQTLSLCLAVSIAVALTLTTLGISTSAGAQVSSVFDAQLNREVTATWNNGPTSTAAELADIPAQTNQLAGVDAAAGVQDFDPVTVAGVAGARVVQPHSYSGDIQTAARLTVRYPSWRTDQNVKPGEVLIGVQLAQLLELGPLERGPVVTINRTSFQVVGIIEQSPRLPQLQGELLVPENTPGFVNPKTTRAVLLTAAGAAQQVARQVPIAVNPYSPETVSVQAPSDAKGLRVKIEQGVQTTLIAFSILAIVVAVAALTNAMLLAVTARRGEIGMRKALGARSRHVAWLLAAESAYVGAVGGAVGLALGFVAVLVITLTQQWTPVFDIRLGPLAVVAGIVIGILGGTTAVARAVRIRPADTLRQ